MKLYGDKNSLLTRKVFATLIEKHVAFELMPKTAYSPGDITAVGAFPGRVREPVLVDGDAKIMGAMAICAYLETKYPEPALLPDDAEERARVLYIEECFYGQLADLISEIAINDAGEWLSQPERADMLVEHRFMPIAKYLEGLVSARRYIASDRISAADISVGLALMKISRHAWIHASGPYTDPSIFTRLSPALPALTRYCEAMWGRTSLRSSSEVLLIWADSIGVKADGSLSRNDNISAALRKPAANESQNNPARDERKS